jgi:hypothetical protein
MSNLFISLWFHVIFFRGTEFLFGPVKFIKVHARWACIQFKFSWRLGHLLSLKIGETIHFQTLVFLGKEFPQYMYSGKYQPWAQILKFLTRPNLYGAHQFNLKIFYINDYKKKGIADLPFESESRTPSLKWNFLTSYLSHLSSTKKGLD